MPVSRMEIVTESAAGFAGVPGFDRQSTRRWHGVAGIHHHIQDHLLDLPRIGAHGLQFRRQPDGEFDILAQHAPQHAIHFLHQHVEIDQRRANALAAAEGQQLAGKVGGALGGFDHLLEILARGIARHAWRPAACANSR